MKKIFSLCVLMAISMSLFAQLAWDTEMTKDDFDNAQTVISKTSNVSFSNPVLGLGGGLSIGKVSLSGIDDECVIALSQTGIAEKLTFAWQGGTYGSLTVYQSADHNTWTQVYTADGNFISTDTEAEANLATNTRYLKFAVSGVHTAVTFRKIKVTELKRLSASTDEWPFGISMVDDAISTKNVTVTWTNIVAEVSSTDPHFSASLSSIGQKNLIDQSTVLTISYAHTEAGSHSGEIVIAGEGKEVRIAVSGTTNKYDQSLTWIQTLGEYLTTDQVTLNAFTSSGLEVVYESSDSTVAYVENGVVQIVCAGEVTLTATQPGNYKFNAATPIEKTLVVRKNDPMIGIHAEAITYGQPLSEAVLQETVGQVAGTLQWVDIKPDSVFNAGDYVLQVLFTPDNSCAYNNRTMPVVLHVNKAAQTIVWEDQETALTVGENIASTAVLSSGLPITYAYTQCLLSIEEGMIEPENEGEVTVIAYHPGNENYLPTTVIMQTFVIAAAPQVPTNTEQLTPEQRQQAVKYLHGGKVYLHYAGQVYDAEGKRL